MSPNSQFFDIVERAPGRVDVTLRGQWSDADAQAYEEAMIQAVASKIRVRVLINLSELVSCTLSVRQVLSGVQRKLGESNCRTAYVANRPRLRSIALWVVHMAEDGEARSVPTQNQAEDWLLGETDRVTSIRQSTESRLANLRRLRGAK